MFRLHNHLFPIVPLNWNLKRTLFHWHREPECDCLLQKFASPVRQQEFPYTLQQHVNLHSLQFLIVHTHSIPNVVSKTKTSRRTHEKSIPLFTRKLAGTALITFARRRAFSGSWTAFAFLLAAFVAFFDAPYTAAIIATATSIRSLFVAVTSAAAISESGSSSRHVKSKVCGSNRRMKRDFYILKRDVSLV